MPSLRELREFKDSFGEIGREKADLAARDIPYNDLELPDSEPEPLSGEAGFAPLPDASGTPEDDFNPPPGLLSGLADDIGAGLPDDFGTGLPGDFGAGLPDDFGTGLHGDFGADLLGDFGLAPPDFPAEDDKDKPPAEDLEELDGDLLPEEPEELPPEPVKPIEPIKPKPAAKSSPTAPGAFDIESLGIENAPLDLGGERLDLGGESFDMGGEMSDAGSEPLDLSGDNFDMGSEPFDLGGDSFDMGSEPLDLGGSFDMGGEPLEEIPAEEPADVFTPESESAESSFDAGFSDLYGESAEGSGGEAESGSGQGDLALINLDDLFAPTQKPGKKAAARPAPSASEDEVEEIQLSDEELDQFNKTLSSYPLNLRIACEELIVEKAVAPNLMSKLIRMLIDGAPARETAALAGKILDRKIIIPRGFEKSSGEAMEAEQASFAYIFVHKFLPMLRLFAIIAVMAGSVGYLVYQFIYKPISAEKLYKIGYERIFAGEYQRANDRFNEAFERHRRKVWFYRYAEAFRDERQYIFAEQKYDELLRHYPRDKKGVLDYAGMETNYLRNYEKADRLLRHELLDYAPDDQDGLLALGDNSLAWGEIDRSKYEEARFAYARLLEKYGWKDPIMERMMKYFIRTDNLKEVLPYKEIFTNTKKHKISADSLAELGGYLLDKQMEEQRGVPNEYIERITGVRDLLLQAVNANPALPESHYHLARYYHNLGSSHEEKITLETAIKAFAAAPEGSIRRINYRIDAHKRYADTLIDTREFFAAEEILTKGIGLYENAISRRLIAKNPEYGKLYAALGDLEYFTKVGNWERALENYKLSEQSGWAPPEIQYRMGGSYYQLKNYKSALEYFFKASANLPLNRRLLFALGNASYERGDYFASQAYFNRLLDVLEAERSRLPVLLPNDRPEFLELAERLMSARNNSGVVYEALAKQTGNKSYRNRSMALYAESGRAWDSLTRNPQSMIRSTHVPLPHLNAQNALYPQQGYEPQIFTRIDRDVLEPSRWEQLAPVSTFGR